MQEIEKAGDITACICFTGYLGEQTLSQQSSKELIKITECNYLAQANLLELIAAYFEQKKQKGFIAGVSSVAGDRGRKSNYHYGAAKAAFTTFLSGLRNRLADKNIHVLTVKPGFVNTKMTQEMDLPEALTAEPEEVANNIYKAHKKQKNVIYIKPVWFWIMLIIKHIPEFIFKKTDL
jgi:short-subunit dehydrogenase